MHHALQLRVVARRNVQASSFLQRRILLSEKKLMFSGTEHTQKVAAAMACCEVEAELEIKIVVIVASI